jgi:hypothetical protein
MRAPLASVVDYNHITLEMENRKLFPDIRDSELRGHIKHAILGLPVMIPSIKAFYENMKYFEIGVRIIKSHLFYKPIRTTLYKAMCSQWSLRDDNIAEC